MSKANNLLAETRAIETRNEFGLSNTEAINIFEVLKYNVNLNGIHKSLEKEPDTFASYLLMPEKL